MVLHGIFEGAARTQPGQNITLTYTQHGQDITWTDITQTGHDAEKTYPGHEQTVTRTPEKQNL